MLKALSKQDAQRPRLQSECARALKSAYCIGAVYFHYISLHLDEPINIF